jgi:hypothetical protein
MASPAQLMTTVSDATGVPLPTITDIDRRLVKGNLRTKGGRGFNAARMTPLDAARLLTAILGSPQANTSAEAVLRYAETHVDRRRSSEGLFGGIEVDDLAHLPARHSFVDGLAALIGSAANGALAALLTTGRKPWRPRVEIFAFTRATYARIRLSELPNYGTVNVEYVLANTATERAGRNAPGHKKDASVAEAQGDLEQSRRITDRTILAIANLLAEEG